MRRPPCPAPDPLVVCVAGNPNVGKSSLFNSLTGSSRETANCAGVSVDACAVCTRWEGRPIEVVDLPGSYSLDGPGDDQQAARGALLERRPDVVVAVADATNLARSLYLPLQLLDLGYRVVVALNLSDEAKRRGRMPDAEVLSRDLGVPVVPTVAPRGKGLVELEAAVLRVSAGGGLGETAGTPLPAPVEQRVEEVALHVAARSEDGLHAPGGLSARAAAIAVLEGDAAVAALVGLGSGGFLTEADEGLALEISKARHAEARALAAAAQDTRAAADRWWRLTTAPRTGIPIMLGVITAVFATLFIVGDLLARVLTAAWTAWISPAVISVVTAIFGDGTVGRVVLWGVDGGILATLAVGIPYILTFYFILALVEDTGYMNAAAFLSDRIMHRIGLHGRAIIPLIAAGGCNVPAIIATRSLTQQARAHHRRRARHAHAVQRADGGHHRRRGRRGRLAVRAAHLRGDHHRHHRRRARHEPAHARRQGRPGHGDVPVPPPGAPPGGAQDLAAVPRVRLGRRPHHPARQHGPRRALRDRLGVGARHGAQAHRRGLAAAAHGGRADARVRGAAQGAGAAVAAGLRRRRRPAAPSRASPRS